jgi:hypothetical protein
MTRPGSWIPATASALGAAIARRALLDVGIAEDPPGSNRSPEIDLYLQRAGVAVGLPWCAAAVATWFRECGAQTPASGAASTDAWMGWAKAHQLWGDKPTIGAAVVYGKDGDAEHIGVVVRIAPLLMTVEGNAALDASNTREGIAVDLKLRQGSGWILGYVRPAPYSMPAPSPTGPE